MERRGREQCKVNSTELAVAQRDSIILNLVYCSKSLVNFKNFSTDTEQLDIYRYSTWLIKVTDSYNYEDLSVLQPAVYKRKTRKSGNTSQLESKNQGVSGVCLRPVAQELQQEYRAMKWLPGWDQMPRDNSISVQQQRIDVQAQDKEHISVFSTFLFILSLNGLGNAHSHWWGWFFFTGVPIQMLISSLSTLHIAIPRMFYHLSGHLLFKVTHKSNHHSCLNIQNHLV